MRKRLVSIVSAMALTPALIASPVSAAEVETNPDLEAVVAAGSPGVIGALTVDDQITYEGAGYANIEGKRAATGTEAYRIGSVTKTMVATATLQQVDAGRLDLDASVESYLPGVVPDGEAVTLRNLLQHTSGIPEYTPKMFVTPEGQLDIESYANAQIRPQQLVDFAFAPGEPSQAAPGTFSYSNTNYVLVGMILEKVTGQPVSELLRHNVFLPAGMNSTILRNEDPVIDQPALSGYLVAPGVEEVYDNTRYTPSVFWAAGGVTSTPADVNRFFDALVDGNLISPEMLVEMSTNTVPFAEGSPTSYGLGLMRYDLNCAGSPVTLFGHDGSVFGYGNQAFTTADGSVQSNYVSNTYVALNLEPFNLLIDYTLNQMCGLATAPTQAA